MENSIDYRTCVSRILGKLGCVPFIFILIGYFKEYILKSRSKLAPDDIIEGMKIGDVVSIYAFISYPALSIPRHDMVQVIG